MRNVRALIAISLGLAQMISHAQTQADQINFRRGQLGGVRLYGVSLYSGYSTTAYPVGLAQAATPGLRELGGTANYGATASLGWQRQRERGAHFSVLYSGTFDGSVRYSNLNAFGQALSVSFDRSLSPKWTISISGSAQDSTMSQFLYQPSALSVIAQVPATFDDLAAAMAVGKFSNSQVASMLTATPLLNSPARSLLLGNRILSYSAQAGLSYAFSSRLSFHLSSFTAAGQSRRGATAGIPEDRYSVPRSMGLNGGASLNYALSPRTQLGVGAENNYVSNKYQKGHASTFSGSFGRKMGPRWFLALNGGISFTTTLANTYSAPPARQGVGGGSLGFRTFQHTLVASYGRTSSDQFGFALGTTTMSSGNWTWSRPGSTWAVSISGGQQQIRRSGFASISGWQTTAGLSRQLSRGASMSAQYVYVQSSGTYTGLRNDVASHSIRLSLSWAPDVSRGGQRN